jgi:hypothetical protein
VTDKFEELVCTLECALLEKHAAPYSDRGEREYNAARSALLAAIRELERPTHAYCIVEAPGYDRGEVLHISLDKVETEATIAQMNDPKS